MNDFAKRYLILFPLAAYFFYDMFCVRRNEFSKNREFKVGGRLIEQIVVGPLVTRYLLKTKKNIYRQDTEEVDMIKEVISKVVAANNLADYINLEHLVIKMVHDDTLALFMNVDQTFFLSVQVIKTCDMREEELALLICHELAHYLLDH